MAPLVLGHEALGVLEALGLPVLLGLLGAVRDEQEADEVADVEHLHRGGVRGVSTCRMGSESRRSLLFTRAALDAGGKAALVVDAAGRGNFRFLITFSGAFPQFARKNAPMQFRANYRYFDANRPVKKTQFLYKYISAKHSTTPPE